MQRLNVQAELELLKAPQTLLDYSGGTNPIYVGKSFPGAATSAPAWQIVKLTYDGNGNVTVVKLAGGSPAADQIWDNRVSLTYA